MDPHSRLFMLYSNKVACSQYYPLTIQVKEGWVANMPHLVWQPAPHQLPAHPPTEDRPTGRTARGLASWSESQDWQERFWWPFHQKSTLRDLAYGDCIWTGECTGAGTEDLPQYILAALEVTREQLRKGMDRGWLNWGDKLALVCIILCLLESATRASVAFGRGLRLTRNAVKHYLENRHH